PTGSVDPKIRALLNTMSGGLTVKSAAASQSVTSKQKSTSKIYLVLNSKGSEATRFQQSMNDIGLLKGSPTGYFGPLMQSAVFAYQYAHHLTPTGTIDQPTLDSVNAYLNSIPTIPAAAPSPDNGTLAAAPVSAAAPTDQTTT